MRTEKGCVKPKGLNLISHQDHLNLREQCINK